jgi:glycosyltransferase involved in cell wall biosynthesis
MIGNAHDVESELKSLNLGVDDIHIMSDISNREMRELYSRVRLTLFPSRYEAFGLVALESLASGTPVIASDTVAGELVRHGYNGFRTPSDNPEAIAQFACRLLRDDELWTYMSSNALEVAKEFAQEKVLPRILSTYESALGNGISESSAH